MRAIAVIALLGLLLGRGLAQAEPRPPADKEPAASRETTLSFSGEGERWWWAENAKGEPLSPPQKTRDASITIKLPPDADTLWVYDAKTGNLAQLKAADLKEKTELTSDRFSHVARVQVNLQAQGKPVASAIVQLTDADGKTHTRVLEPSAEGILIFERVPLGKVSLTARYGDEEKTSQETTLKAERETRVPIIELALSGSVATLEVAPKGREGQGETETPTTSRIGAIVMFIIALALAVGVIVFLVRLATQKPQQLGEAMSKLGVELPQPAQIGQGSATATATPAPPQPDLPPLDSAGVPPTANASAITNITIAPIRLVWGVSASPCPSLPFGATSSVATLPLNASSIIGVRVSRSAFSVVSCDALPSSP